MKLKLVAIGLVVVLVITLALVLPNKIKITNVTCQSQWGECDPILATDLSKYAGSSFNDVGSGVKKYLTSSALVEKFTISYSYPSTLRVNLTQKRGIYGVAGSEKGLVALVDTNGYAVGSAQSTNLPMLIVDRKTPRVGEKMDEETFFGLKLLNDMNYLFQIKTGSLTKDAIEFKLSDGKIVLFPKAGDIKLLIPALQLIIGELNSIQQQSKMNGKVITVIDLRFSNPVLR